MRIATASVLTRDKSELGFRSWELKKFDISSQIPTG
jgi:hypothetical protein